MKGLLSVSFGTSHEDTRKKTIDIIEEDLRAQFPEWTFYSAWTSGRIIEKVKARGEHHDTLEEAFERMSADGINDLVVSTMCLMRGAEMAKVMRAIDEWSSGGNRAVHVAAPLLASSLDRKAVARVIYDEFADVPEDEALLLMGHGSPKMNRWDDANAVYRHVQEELHALGRTNFFVATVEGEPTFDDILPAIQKTGVSCVHLAPLMIVAGDHAKNDLAGEGEDSWASRLEACGFRTKAVLKGLGEYPGIQKIVCDHVSDVLVIREVALRG